MKVYIAQLKCPGNHCVLAVAGEYENEEEARILAHRLDQEFGALVARRVLKPECGLCKATELGVEVRPTRFATMQEAVPYLRAEEEKQTRRFHAARANRN